MPRIERALAVSECNRGVYITPGKALALPCFPQGNSSKTVLFVAEKPPTSLAIGGFTPLKSSGFSHFQELGRIIITPLVTPSLNALRGHRRALRLPPLPRIDFGR
jgi:hypothetical protein